MDYCVCVPGGTGCSICRKEEKMEDKNIALPEGVNTRLLHKNYSPLIVRKYQMRGWPMFVSLICDWSLSDLDMVVNKAQSDFGEIGDDIQEIRNFCGFLSDRLVSHYNGQKENCVEGVAVIWYVDKCFVSSCYGDLMTHTKCAIELYGILNMMPHI